MQDLISKLSEIRSGYNCFDEDEEPYYRALSEAIRILSKRADGDTISRADAIDAVISLCDDCDSDYCGSCRVNYPGEKDARKVLKDLPSAQTEIIYCRECKWKQGAECVMFADVRPFPDDFCSRAERSKEQ